MSRAPKRPTKERGYGKEHEAVRRRLTQLVLSGSAYCNRCGGPIAANRWEPCYHCGRVLCGGRSWWDVGHDDQDRSAYTGPEHSCCNRIAGARKGGRAASAKTQLRVWSRDWLT